MRGTERHSTAKKRVVIHGHFYQPPRENPWLNHIEQQPGAAPHHDWNERIYAECYRPNGYARLLDENGMITGIHNNYRDMSFNFGPTLMSWLKDHHPVTTRRIIDGDITSVKANDGHGNAVAQVYNHLIMPLASRRDQITQLRWAKESFRTTFRREPEGIWLAETAINMETVQCLIDERFSFVILAPRQAEAVRPLGRATDWTDEVDTRRPYRLFARNAAGKKTGGHLDVFFFDEGLSKEISFNSLLQDAHLLGNRINECYTPTMQQDELVVIATDGETFGHHKPFGDMCLAYFFTHVAPALDLHPVNFATYLSHHPPQHEVRLKNAFGEGTAWSCAHGVGRWIRDCGCSTGGKDGWHQKWRGPLREALDTLQECVDETYLTACREAGIDPWELRNRYGQLLGRYTEKKWKRLLTSLRQRHHSTAKQSQRLRRLLEAQKFMLFSYTSCGWFFSEISGIEPMQNLAYACRALQLGIEPEQQAEVTETFMRELAAAPSNLNDDTGASLFERHILPFFFHERMLAFAAAMQAALAVNRKKNYVQYGYQYRIVPLSPDSSHKSDDPTLRWPQMFHVVLDHPVSGEGNEWLVIIDVSNRFEPQGWVLPWKGIPQPEMVTHTRLTRNPDTQLYTLNDLFLSLRTGIASVYLNRLDRHSRKKFQLWMRTNESDLALLQSFHPELPGYFKAPLQFELQKEWDEAFEGIIVTGNEETSLDRLSTVARRAAHFNCILDYTASGKIAEQLLTGELDALSKELSIDRCDRIRYLLNTVDRYSLPVSKHRLEDIFYPVLSGQVTRLYRSVTTRLSTDTPESNDDSRELLLKLLQFARRMNFNTDNYLLS